MSYPGRERGAFATSSGDIDYVEKVSHAVANVNLSIEIVGNDLSCINYPPILEGIKKARSNDAHVSAFYTNAPDSLVEKLKDLDIELLRGSRSIFGDAEYVVADTKVMVSYLTKGKRVGYWDTDQRFLMMFTDEYDRGIKTLTEKSGLEMVNKMKRKSKLP